MKNSEKITAIILAAGNSTRYGKGKNKNFERINDKSVIQYSIEAFSKNEYIDDIIIAIKEIELTQIKSIIDRIYSSKPIKIIIGGESRKQSVQNCIKASNSDIVIIQDGARPAIKQKYIRECIESMEDFKGVTIGVMAKDTIKVTDNNEIVNYTTIRKNTWQIQTPQCFDRKILAELYEKYKNEDITDDCTLLEKENYKIKIINGDYSNIKITTPEDMKIIKEIMKDI